MQRRDVMAAVAGAVVAGAMACGGGPAGGGAGGSGSPLTGLLWRCEMRRTRIPSCGIS